jgi:glucose-6-phosphate 1-dehydrogenase
LSELGRFPLYFNIIKGMLLYWYCLENLGKEFPLLKEAYNETKLLYLSKKPSWYGSINIIVNILKTTNTDIINLLLKKPLGKFKNNVNIFFKSL